MAGSQGGLSKGHGRRDEPFPREGSPLPLTPGLGEGFREKVRHQCGKTVRMSPSCGKDVFFSCFYHKCLRACDQHCLVKLIFNNVLFGASL